MVIVISGLLLKILAVIVGLSGFIYILIRFRIFSFIQKNYSKNDFFDKATRVKNKYVSFIIQLSINLTIDQLNKEDADETIIGRVYLFDEAAKTLGSEYQSQNLWDKPHWIPFIMDSFNEHRGCEGLTYSKTKKLLTYTTFCIDYEDYFTQNQGKEKILGISNKKFKQFIDNGIKTVLCVPIFLYHKKQDGGEKIELISEKCTGILSYVSNKNFSDSDLSKNHNIARIHAKFFSYIFSKYNWSEESGTTDLTGIRQAEIRQRDRRAGSSREKYVETVPGIYFMPETKREKGLSEFINIHISEKMLREEMEEFVDIEPYL